MKRYHSILAAIGVVCMVLLNYPFVSLAKHSMLVLGWPVLYVYFFSLWLILIIVLVVVLSNQSSPPDDMV